MTQPELLAASKKPYNSQQQQQYPSRYEPMFSFPHNQLSDG